MLSQELEEEKWSTVRIPTELLDAVENVIKNLRDEFGLLKYKNKSQAIAEAVKEFLKKHKPKEA